MSAIAWGADFVASLAALALLGTALASVLWFGLLREAPLGRLTAFAFLTPVFGRLLGWALCGEALGPWKLAGAVAIVVAVRRSGQAREGQAGALVCRLAGSGAVPSAAPNERA